MNRRLLLPVAVALTVLWALGLTGQADYHDAQLERQHQCAMVEEGSWPQEVNPSCPAPKETDQ